MSEPSKGERMARVGFNPSGSELVDEIKVKTAELIDLINKNEHLDSRLAELAISAYECAGMWAVKMATADDGGEIEKS
jgi:hypothetical protein